MTSSTPQFQRFCENYVRQKFSPEIIKILETFEGEITDVEETWDCDDVDEFGPLYDRTLTITSGNNLHYYIYNNGKYESITD